MLAEDANMQKQKKREEQIRNWRERELSDPISIESSITTTNSSSTNYDPNKPLIYRKETKVKFPKGCVFLAACSSGDIDEVKQYLKLGKNTDNKIYIWKHFNARFNYE